MTFSCSTKNKKLEVKTNHKKDSVETKILNFEPTKISKSFIDKSVVYGLSNISAVHFNAIDWNNDGYTDLVYLEDFYSIPKFLKFDPKLKKFIEVKYSPFKKPVRASYLVFADFDKDGILDCLTSTLNQKTELTKDNIKIYKGSLKNSVYKLDQVSTGDLSKDIMPAATVIPFDFDLDGKLDLFIGNWYDLASNTYPLPDKLFKGDGFKFKDYSILLEGEYEYDRETKIYPNARPTFGASICDVDRNGFPDILTSSNGGFSNKLWLNLLNLKTKNRLYRDFGPESGYASDSEGAFSKRDGGNSFYGICSDYNEDGLWDIAVGEIYHAYSAETQDRSSILTGSQVSFPPRFLRTEYHKDDGSGTWSQGDRRASWIDLDMDGLQDLIIDNSGFPPSSRMISFIQSSDHSFEDKALEYGIDLVNPAGTVILDINRDGKPDILTGQSQTRNASIKKRVYLFENQMNSKKMLRFYFAGKRSNRFGWGAMLVIRTDKRQIIRNISSIEGGLVSQNEEGEFVFLDENENLVEVKTRWPLRSKEVGKEHLAMWKEYKLNPKSKGDFVLCDNGKFKKGRNLRSCH